MSLFRLLRSLLTICSGLAVLQLSFSPAARAESPLFCQAPEVLSETSLLFGPLINEGPALADGAIELSSGEGEISLTGRSELSEDVIVRYGDQYLRANTAIFDPAQQRLELSGDVEYSGIASVVRGGGARFDYGRGEIEFTDSKFALPDGRGHGEAGQFALSANGLIRLGEVDYTSCPAGNEDWLIRAKSIDLDTANGIGTARKLRLEFRGVPILYAPYLSFPISDARKSGFLIPDFGTSANNGTELSIPYYWNIAPNYDLTVTPRLLTKRGLELDTRFRYLSRRSEGFIDVQYLPNDSDFNADRTYVTLDNTSDLAGGWRVKLDAQDVSDINFFEDLGDGQSSASTTFLNRNLSVQRPGKTWFLGASLESFQVLDPSISDSDKPYRRLPEIVVNGHWPGLQGMVDLQLENQLTYFDRDNGATGWRLHSRQALSLPIERNGLFLIPEAAFQYTTYKLSDQLAGTDSSPHRAMPSFSLDAGARFERKLPGERGLIQTLTPRILYAHTPYRDQNDIPVFDTIEPDFNLVQIFRKSPFVGIDRIPDIDQISIGITSRILNPKNGQALVSATLGQTRYLSAQGVSLPGSPARTSESSDYVAEIEIQLLRHWNFDIGHQWSSDDAKTVKSEFRLQYQPDAGKVLNLAYRFREASLEQADLSWSWPIGERWNFVGRYNYSLRDKTTLERFVGLEYESCCWAVRVLSRRYIRRRDGTADSSVAIQLELKGLTSVGDPADKRLERGILGYGNRRDY